MEKQQIIDTFMEKVKGVPIHTEGNVHHCGKHGHWLETRMGLSHNSKNEPDMYGYEMKTGETVTTFVDKAPDRMMIGGMEIPKRDKLSKTLFWDKYASKKESEHKTIGGWSVDKFNKSGQRLVVDDNSLHILYDFQHDMREDKETLELNKTPHKIMEWFFCTLQKTIENKFNQKGFFKCKRVGDTYEKICFGGPITFDRWIDEVKKGVIYHDGYSKLNGRGRHVFRASNAFWDGLITEEY